MVPQNPMKLGFLLKYGNNGYNQENAINLLSVMNFYHL
jgi:hypothetical protein